MISCKFLLLNKYGVGFFSTSRTRNLFGKERSSLHVTPVGNLIDRPSDSLYTLTANAVTNAEQVVKKHKFFAYAGYANSPENFRKFVDSVKVSKGARKCWAYVSKTCEISSDGVEVTNTAGPPILNAIKIENMTDCVVVVARLCGGAELDLYGLVRAYGGITRNVLQMSEKRKYVPLDNVTIAAHVNDYEAINRACQGHVAFEGRHGGESGAVNAGAARTRRSSSSGSGGKFRLQDVVFSDDAMSFTCSCDVLEGGMQHLHRKLMDHCAHPVSCCLSTAVYAVDVPP